MSAPRREPKPPLAIRAIGQAISLGVARMPRVWALLRGPTQRFWERAAATWQERIDPDRPEHLAPLAAACDRVAGEPGRILELGTGTGAGARMLARRFPGAAIDAVDLSPAMIDAARARSADVADRISFAVADASSLPFAAESFDVVVQLNMPVFPEEVARVLRREGHAIVASSLGPDTPYYTPEGLLRRRFLRLGFERTEAGSAEDGTYFIARR
jgi:SAM-dependent methyltransferase